MFLNQGKFRQNGGCGYILKPKIMRDSNETGIIPCLVNNLATYVISIALRDTVYNPNTMTQPHHAVTPINLKITVSIATCIICVSSRNV